MNEKAQELLMMFIKDSYSGSGKITKATALKMMKFVESQEELQNHVNHGDKARILKYRMSEK